MIQHILGPISDLDRLLDYANRRLDLVRVFLDSLLDRPYRLLLLGDLGKPTPNPIVYQLQSNR